MSKQVRYTTTLNRCTDCPKIASFAWHCREMKRDIPNMGNPIPDWCPLPNAEPVCTTCGKPKGENTFCSNAFHVIEPLYIQREENRYKNIPDWYGGDDYPDDWPTFTFEQLRERHKKLEKKLGIQVSDYESCPVCRSSFSFRKPSTDGICPWCDNNISRDRKI
jgi:hypothetical protein